MKPGLLALISVILFMAVAATAVIARADGTFVAIPERSLGLYRVDFARHYFENPGAEQAARARLEGLYDELETHKGRLGASADDLLNALDLYARATVDYIRHENYLYLRSAVNTEDHASAAANAELGAAYAARTAFVSQELADLDPGTFAAFVEQRPALARFEFAIAARRRFAAHHLPLAEEELLEAQGPALVGWQYELYEQVLAATDFGAVDTPEGPLDVQRERRAIADHPDARVREAGFRKRTDAYTAQRDLYAFALGHLAHARNGLARLHHFEDAAEASYFENDWTKAEVSSLLSALAAAVDLYEDYQRRRVVVARKARHLEDVNVWDAGGSLSGDFQPRFAIDDARKRILEALAPLGGDFRRNMAALLDPNNGRLDIAPGPHRKSGGFSLGFIGVDSVFFTGGYAGAWDDMRVLTHEATHAVHRQMMSEHGVSPLYANGPHYLFESFAAFSELLLAQHLYAAASDPATEALLSGAVPRREGHRRVRRGARGGAGAGRLRGGRARRDAGRRRAGRTDPGHLCTLLDLAA